MSGHTLTEKVIARAAGVEAVSAGDEVWAKADRIIMNDTTGPRRIAGLIDELGGVRDRDRIVLASDHFVPPANLRQAEILKTTREWARAQELPHYFEYQGVLHNLVLQESLVLPGMLLVGADSHTVTAGAMGAVSVAVGSTELATVIATGEVWLRVPQGIRIELNGGLSPWVEMRDVTMHLLGEYRSDFALYSGVEFDGSFTDELDLEERLVLSNQGIEMGSKNSTVVPTKKLLDHLEEAGSQEPFTPIYPDPDADYAVRYELDVGALEPLVALPHAVDNLLPAREVQDGRMDVAWIGSCVGGRYADLRAAAEVLNGKQTRIPLLVNPATHAIYQRAVSDGTMQILLDAGAIFQPAGCGPCAGLHSGILAADERVITTATRNFRGRMGSVDSGVYLASPYTVAATAVAGRLVDPREVMVGSQVA